MCVFQRNPPPVAGHAMQKRFLNGTCRLWLAIITNTPCFFHACHECVCCFSACLISEDCPGSPYVRSCVRKIPTAPVSPSACGSPHLRAKRLWQPTAPVSPPVRASLVAPPGSLFPLPQYFFLRRVLRVEPLDPILMAPAAKRAPAAQLGCGGASGCRGRLG